MHVSLASFLDIDKQFVLIYIRNDITIQIVNCLLLTKLTYFLR